MKHLDVYEHFTLKCDVLILDKFTEGTKMNSDGKRYFFKVELPDGTSKDVESTEEMWGSYVIGGKIKIQL